MSMFKSVVKYRLFRLELYHFENQLTHSWIHHIIVFMNTTKLDESVENESDGRIFNEDVR